MSGYQICCISLNKTDRLRLISCPPQIIPEMRCTIRNCWGDIQNERNYSGSYEFKLSGNPWNPDGKGTVRSRRLLAQMLIMMARNGWNFLQATDCSKKEGAKDVLFFEYGTPDEKASLFAVSFNRYDRLRLIDAPEFFPYLEQAVKSTWPKGIQDKSQYKESLELKLSGNPWYPEGSDTVQAKILLAQIIANFKAIGYKLYASVAICGKQEVHECERVGELDSWVFRKVGPYWN